MTLSPVAPRPYSKSLREGTWILACRGDMQVMVPSVLTWVSRVQSRPLARTEGSAGSTGHLGREDGNLDPMVGAELGP